MPSVRENHLTHLIEWHNWKEKFIIELKTASDIHFKTNIFG